MAAKHHYVPQFLLRNFADSSDRLYVFDKSDSRSWQAAVRDAAAERSFYDLPKPVLRQLAQRARAAGTYIDGMEDVELTMEFSLADIEARAGGVIAEILARRTLGWMSLEDRRRLLHFVVLQYVRSPSQRAMIHATANGLRETLRTRIPVAEHMIDKALDDAGLPAMKLEEAAAEHLRMVTRMADFATHFAAKVWILQEAPPEHPLVIGDSPVTVSNFGPRSDLFYRGTGIGSRNAVIDMPLSPTLNLSMICPSFAGNTEVAWRRRCTGPLPQVLRVWQARQALLDGAGVPLQPENVLHLNARQVRSASRFLYSGADDFDLARQMVTEDEQMRSAPRPKIG